MHARSLRLLGQGYVCPRCASKTVQRTIQRKPASRSFSTTLIANGNPPAPQASGYARLSNRALLLVTGTDTAKFLHGLLTTSVSEPAPGAGFYSSFLTAQGRVLFDVFLYPTRASESSSPSGEGAVAAGSEAGFLVEVDATERDVLLKHLKRHKLRSKVKLRALEQGELDVYSIWREGQRWNAYSMAAQAGREGAHSEGGSAAADLTLLDQRAPGMGERVLLSGASSQHSDLDGLEEATLDQYRIRRYLRGVPEGASEIQREQSLPMAVNLDLMGAIDFKKGCYVGQELTIRTHHTGVVRRRVLPVQLYRAGGDVPGSQAYDAAWDKEIPKAETELEVQGKRGKPGRWIAGVGNVGLAVCRLEMMTDLPVTSEPSSFDTADRFTVVAGEGGEALGVRAFVPDWMRGKIRAPKVQKRVE